MDALPEKEEKAAYNQSRNITELLGNLLGAYIVHMNNSQFGEAVKSIRRIHDIISAKIKDTESQEVDKKVLEVEEKIPQAIETYRTAHGLYIKNPDQRKETEIKIEQLFRYLNKLQDKYGYGMVSLDDPRFAVLKM